MTIGSTGDLTPKTSTIFAGRQAVGFQLLGLKDDTIFLVDMIHLAALNIVYFFVILEVK